jgi:hypothetical protein
MTNEKLPKEFKDKWVKALRSGRYKQSVGRLYRDSDNTFCCLGVACNVAGVRRTKITGTVIWNFARFASKVPPVLQSGRADDSISNQLINLNDEGVPFEVIAGVINEYL